MRITKTTLLKMIIYTLLSSLILWWTTVLFAYIYVGQKTLPRGVFIHSWEISGMEIDRFLHQFQQWITVLEQQQIVLTAKPDHSLVDQSGLFTSHALTFQQLGLQTNAPSIINRITSLESGSIWQRVQKRWQLTYTKLELQFSWDEKKFDQVIEHHWANLQKSTAKDAQIIITTDDQVKYLPETFAYRIEKKKLREQMTALTYKVFDQLRTGEPETIEFTIPLKTIPPAKTVESLKQSGIKEKMAEYTTYFQANQKGRVHNIQSTAKVIHRMILHPGDQFDYNEIIQQVEKQFGFQHAPVIVNGKLVPGIGGGICQVSSTLYNAVLYSGLTVLERRNHSIPVHYVPLGRDATFSSGHINFRFQNQMKTSVYIHIETGDGHITVKLFGTRPKNVTYEIESETIKTIPPPVKYVKNPQLPVGSYKTIQHGKTGYIVDTYRITKEHGKVVHREKISRDHYLATPTLIAGNPKDVSIHEDDPNTNPSPAPKKQIIEDGVSGPVFRP